MCCLWSRSCLCPPPQYRRLKLKLKNSSDDHYWVNRYLKKKPLKRKDPLFSEKLIKREDFQTVFRRYGTDGKTPDGTATTVALALAKPKDSREHSDLHLVLDWLLNLPFFRSVGRLVCLSVSVCRLLLLVNAEGRMEADPVAVGPPDRWDPDGCWTSANA